jgi:hypothetical protein
MDVSSSTSEAPTEPQAPSQQIAIDIDEDQDAHSVMSNMTYLTAKTFQDNGGVPADDTL